MTVGTVFTGHIQEQLPQNKVIVNVDGKNIIMQFSGNAVLGKTIQGKITAVDKGVFFASLLNSSAEDEISEYFKNEFSNEEIRNAVKIFTELKMSFSNEKIRFLMNLNRLFGNMDMAKAVLIKKMNYKMIAGLWKLLSESNLDSDMKKIENILKRVNNKSSRLLSELLHNFSAEKFNIKLWISFLLPDFEKKIIHQHQNIKKQMKFLLKKLLSAELHDDEKEAVRRILNRLHLDNLKSVFSDEYRDIFFSIPLKEDDRWRLLNMAVRQKDGIITVQWQYPFRRIGPVFCAVSSSEHMKKKVRIGVMDEKIKAFLKRKIDLAFPVEYFFLLQNDITGHDGNFIKKVNVFV